MRRISGVVLAAVALMAAPAHAAGPEVVAITLEPQASLTDLDLVVTARDAGATINGIALASSGLREQFGETGCQIPASGAGEPVTFRVPVRPIALSALRLSLTIYSGACGRRPRTVKHEVTLPGLLLPRGRASADPEEPEAGLDETSVDAGPCPDADIMPERFVLPRARLAVVCLINVERAKRGIIELKTSKQLRRAARWHALDMLERRYFDHKRPDGPDFAERIRNAGYIAVTAGENLGYGTEYFATPRAMIEAWMDSPPHRKNMLDPDFRAAGIAVAVPASIVPHEPGATYTVDFAKRR